MSSSRSDLLEQFRKLVLHLKETSDNVSTEDANRAWKEFSGQLSEEKLNTIKELFLSRQSWANPPGLYDVVRETVLNIQTVVEEVKQATIRHIKPAPEFKNCCRGGVINAQTKDGYIYVFRCNCTLGLSRSEGWPMWEPKLDLIYEKL